MHVMDTLWLTQNAIDTLYVLYDNRIQKWNCEYDILNPSKLPASLKIAEFIFLDALFLQYVYLKGHLWMFPLESALTTEYYVSNRQILIELCKRGVFTIKGGALPSCFEFIVVIHDDVLENFMEMLFVMSSLNMSITSQVIKKGKTIAKNTFGNKQLDCNKTIAMNFSKGCQHSICNVVIKSEEHKITDVLLYYWLSFNIEFGNKNINSV